MTAASPCRVLLVEDEAGDASLVRQYLQASRELRFELMWRESLAAAVAEIERSEADVVLLDLSLADSRGLDTVLGMRRAAGMLPIIVLTGHDDTEFALTALDSGAQDYLVKTHLDTDGLVRAIRYAMSRVSLEKRLYESEQRMAMALQGAELGLWDWHIPSGRVVFNTLWAEMLGYQLADIEPSVEAWKRLMHPDDRPAVEIALNAHLRGETPFYQSEHRLRHRDGHWLWVHDSGRVLEWDHHGQPLRAVGIHNDISLRKDSEMRDHLLISALEAVEHGVVITDVEARIEWANRAFETLTGYDRNRVIGISPKDLVKSGLQDTKFYQVLWETILSGNTWRGELVNRRQDGELYDEELVITPVKDEQGVIRHFVGIKQDISERKRIQAELWELATTDGLTGFLNRRHFIVRLEDEFARVQRSPQYRVAVLMLDLDHFKHVNDSHGHAVGDALLKHFAAIIRNVQRKIDVVGRLGGEEFAIFLPNTSLEPARIFAERLRRQLAETPLRLERSGEVRATVSIGIAQMDAADLRADAVLIRADQALYAAKEGGRNQVQIWAEAVAAQARHWAQ